MASPPAVKAVRVEAAVVGVVVGVASAAAASVAVAAVLPAGEVLVLVLPAAVAVASVPTLMSPTSLRSPPLVESKPSG
jgi:hypothetical protein